MTPLRRCGSHALRLRLNFSPEFYSPYPLHIVDFMPLVPLYGDLQKDNAYFQMVIDVIGLQTVSMVKWSDVVFDPVAVFDAIKDRPRSVHSIVWELLLRAGEQHGARVVMDKSLDSVHYADELIRLYPDMLFLNVVRDPRAQVNSMNKAIIHDFDSLLNAQTWVRAQAAGRRLAEQHPDKVLTIRYEDFLANQDAVLRRICAFFGIEYLPAMLDVSRSDEAQSISVLSALWESNASAPIPANIDKFKSAMTDEEIEIIESLAGELMDYYGYQRMTPAARRVTPAMADAARARSDAARERAWADLKANNNRDYRLRRFRIDYIDMARDRLMRNAAQLPGVVAQTAVSARRSGA
ncbi:MAG TPA: sulfotransferase, partial [Acidiferrobacterales bacterium]